MVWFTAIAALGLVRMAANPEVLAGLSPHYAIALAFSRASTAWPSL